MKDMILKGGCHSICNLSGKNRFALRRQWDNCIVSLVRNRKTPHDNKPWNLSVNAWNGPFEQSPKQWVVWEVLPAAALWASAIAIRETSSTTTCSSATAASQTNTGVLYSHPENTVISLLEPNIISQGGSREICSFTFTFHYIALCHRAHKQHPQHLWGRQTPTINRMHNIFNKSYNWCVRSSILVQLLYR